jgi:rod shape-determining protein MreD
LHVLPLLLLAQAVQLVIRLIVSGKFPGWLYFIDGLVAAVLWPIVTWLLLAPQRRAIDRDETRPI